LIAKNMRISRVCNVPIFVSFYIIIFSLSKLKHAKAYALNKRFVAKVSWEIQDIDIT